MQIKPNLDQLGVPLIAIGNGSPKFAQKFKQALDFTGEIYLDSESKSFKALSLPRITLWQVLKRWVLDRNMYKFWNDLSKTYKSADLEGDGQQTGGVFVVGPGIGRPMRYAFYEANNKADQFADTKAILEALDKTGSHSSSTSSTSS